MTTAADRSNPNRQDDGFGSSVIEHLKKLDAQEHWEGVELLDAGCGVDAQVARKSAGMDIF